MKNYIEVKHDGTAKMFLTSGAVDALKSFCPRGCPFDGYSLLNLLDDFLGMYSWRIHGSMTVKDFIIELQHVNYNAVVYGDAIIHAVECY